MKLKTKTAIIPPLVAVVLFAGCSDSKTPLESGSPTVAAVTETVTRPVPIPTPAPPDVVPAPESPVAAEPELDTTTREEPEIEAPNLAESEGVHLKRLVLARAVENREPIEAGTTFEIDSEKRIYAFISVVNPTASESEVTVSWAPADGGRERGKTIVSVGAHPRWRTWAYTRGIQTPGKWKVIIRNSAGEIIGEAPFEVTES